MLASGQPSTTTIPGTYHTWRNYTENYLAIWLSRDEQTLGQTVHKVHVTRRKCNATWRITTSNITLLDAHILETKEQAQTSHNQSLIDMNSMDVVGLYSRFVIDFDFVRHPRRNAINTVPSLIATMLWARLVTSSGPGDPTSWPW